MLAIDVGNTRIKWGIWQQNVLEQKGASNYRSEQLEEDLDQCFAPLLQQDSVYACCVSSEQVQLSLHQWFQRQWGVNVHFIESQSQLMGVRNGYDDPHQMGADRWVAMIAAYTKYQKAVCVIDCGTAITLDIVSAQGQHLGGLIMPGLDMMKNALYMGTRRIKPAIGDLCDLGMNTADAVTSGCYQLLVNGLQGLVVKHSAAVEGDLLCVVTGGNAELLVRENQIHCCHDADLILYGLNVIANIKK